MGEGDVVRNAEEKQWGKQSLAWPWGGVYERQENQLIDGLETENGPQLIGFSQWRGK
jgi:hypothetical protein